MSKKVTFGSRPQAPAEMPSSIDEWVAAGAEPEPAKPKKNYKRLTLDLPPELHARVKSACALRGTAIRDEVLRLLQAEFGDKP